MAHQVYPSSKQLLFEIESSTPWNHQFDLKKFFIDRLLQIKDQRPWEDRKVTKPNPTTKEELFKDVVGFLTFGNDLYFEQKKKRGGEARQKTFSKSKTHKNIQGGRCS